MLNFPFWVTFFTNKINYNSKSLGFLEENILEDDLCSQSIQLEVEKLPVYFHTIKTNVSNENDA